MLRKLIKDRSSLLPLILRITLGLILIPQGFHLIINYYDSLDWLMKGTFQLPFLVAYAIIVIEFYGGIFLIAGLSGRLTAGAIGLLVIAAISYHSIPGLSTDLLGQTIGQGIEFHLLVLAITLVLIITGSGKVSLDHIINRVICQNTLKKCTE